MLWHEVIKKKLPNKSRVDKHSEEVLDFYLHGVLLGVNKYGRDNFRLLYFSKSQQWIAFKHYNSDLITLRQLIDFIEEMKNDQNELYKLTGVPL